MWSTTWWWCGWHLKSSSRYSPLHLLPTSSSKSVSSRTGFSRFLCEIELSLQSRAHFADLIFQKCSAPFSFCKQLYVINYLMMMWLTLEIELSTVPCTFCRNHLPKVFRAGQVFHDFYVKSSSRYSLVHILPTSSSKSALSPIVFFHFYVRSSSGYSLECAFCRPHLPKVLRAL